jgi:5-methylcytosine-specific restriction enzyme subunit McrC
MLSYAFTTLKESVYDDVQKESFDNIHNLFAAILAKGIGLQLKQGLYREYLNRVENLPVVRGKIDIPGTIRNRLERRMVVTCDYDELSENNLLNQILKSTVLLLLWQKDVDEKYKAELKKEMLFFSEVNEIDLQHIRWSEIRFQRNNRTYQLLLAICQLLVEGSLLTTESGEYHLASFVDEQRMSRLYEKFILEYYAQEYGQRIKGFSSRALQIPWKLDDGYDELLPVMQTDITLTYGDQTLIIDAKYYERTLQTNFDVQTLHSGNMYQIFTYVKNKEAELAGTGHQVSGMLLYARTDEDLVPDNVYHMSGNKISVKTLDLNQEFSEIQNQLNKIVKDHFGISIRQ